MLCAYILFFVFVIFAESNPPITIISGDGVFLILFKNYYELAFGLNRNLERYDDWATYDYELDKVGPILKLPV